MAGYSPPTTRQPSRGDIVLASFPFADLSGVKRRPAVIIGSDPTQGDFTLAFIGSQQIGSLAPGEMALLPTHPEFAGSGLTVASKVRAGKLVTLKRTLMTRRLGSFGPQWLAELDRCLIAACDIDITPYTDNARQEEQERLKASYGTGNTQALLTALGLSQADKP